MQGLGTEPEVEGDVGVAWGAREVVIFGFAGADMAAFGLQGDEGRACGQAGEVEGIVQDVGVCGGVAPSLGKVGLQGFGEGFQGLGIGGERPAKGF
jgi:hypothetical protein